MMIRNEGSSSILFSKWEKFLPKKKREKKWWKGEKKILKDNETKSERKISNQRLEQKDQETIGKWYLRYSTRRAIHMAALQTRKLVGLTVGLPVSVRCILTLFARHFLAMCPCSVCVPTFYSPLPSPLPPSSCIRIHIYIFPRVSQPTTPLWYPDEFFFFLTHRLVLPPFAFCLLFLCRFRCLIYFKRFKRILYSLVPSSSILVSYSNCLNFVGLPPIENVVFCFLRGRRKRWTDTTSSNQFPSSIIFIDSIDFNSSKVFSEKNMRCSHAQLMKF